jgi:hypothetical protein
VTGDVSMSRSSGHDVAAVLARLDEAHTAATPWFESVTRMFEGLATVDPFGRPRADAAAIVAEHNATPRLVAALRAVLALANEDDARRDDYGYRIRNGLDPSPGDRIRSAVHAALDVETTEAGQ